MSAKWVPSDEELDGLARTIAPPALDSEHVRTSILASAANTKQLSRSSRTPLFVGVGVAMAAAAAFFVWVTRPDEPQAHANVVAIGSASFEHEQRWPSYVVRVDSGRVQFDVATVDSSQRFAAITSDARIELRSSKFLVDAEEKRLAHVEVQEGSLELTYESKTIVLSAGEHWEPTIKTADVIEPPPPTPPIVVVPAPAEPAKPVQKAPQRKAASAAVVEKPSPAVPSPTPPSTPRPGELEFRSGVASLRDGDAGAATKSFAAACAAARTDALGEDACFWVGAAAKRSGQANTAREALTQFLRDFPASARAGEASALLGWLLYEAGELDSAETRFTKAAADRVPKVRTSAARGLEAIKRRRVK